MTTSPSQLARWGVGLEESLLRDAWSSDWASAGGAEGRSWGGRSRGGRGVKAASLGNCVSITGVDISFDGKKPLLVNAAIKLETGRRYALIGENGAGKTTLLRRMGLGAIPGWPNHIRTHYLQQEDARPSNVTITVLDDVLGESAELEMMRQQESELESALRGDLVDEEALLAMTEELCELVGRIETLEASRACKDEKEKLASLKMEERGILKGLGLNGLLGKSCSLLSGGQRTRCALARALIAVGRGQCDLLLLDECTNHLDAVYADWLQAQMQAGSNSISSCIVVAVSHDEAFLSAISTDIMSIDAASQTLTYFQGNFEAYERHLVEAASFNESRVDSQSRKEAHIEKSLQIARERGLDSTIRNTEKKLQRAGLSSRADGKRFKLFSLKTLDESSLKMPEVVSASKVVSKKAGKLDHPFLFDAARAASKGKAKIISFRFPEPAELRTDRALVTLHKRMVRWNEGGSSVPLPRGKAAPPAEPTLAELTLELHMGDRVALVGRNGSGKTSLLTALAHLLQATGADEGNTEGAKAEIVSIAGSVHVEAGLVSGFVGQQHIDGLSHSLLVSPLELLQRRLTSAGKTWSDLDIRTHLGKFALGGSISMHAIGALSGGEKARLAMAISTLFCPQVLILDEPTNHLSPSSLAALKAACLSFQGCIVFSSHNAAFVETVATKVVELKGGRATVRAAVAAAEMEGRS